MSHVSFLGERLSDVSIVATRQGMAPAGDSVVFLLCGVCRRGCPGAIPHDITMPLRTAYRQGLSSGVPRLRRSVRPDSIRLSLFK